MSLSNAVIRDAMRLYANQAIYLNTGTLPNPTAWIAAVDEFKITPRFNPVGETFVFVHQFVSPLVIRDTVLAWVNNLAPEQKKVFAASHRSALTVTQIRLIHGTSVVNAPAFDPVAKTFYNVGVLVYNTMSGDTAEAQPAHASQQNHIAEFKSDHITIDQQDFIFHVKTGNTIVAPNITIGVSSGTVFVDVVNPKSIGGKKIGLITEVSILTPSEEEVGMTEIYTNVMKHFTNNELFFELVTEMRDKTTVSILEDIDHEKTLKRVHFQDHQTSVNYVMQEVSTTIKEQFYLHSSARTLEVMCLLACNHAKYASYLQLSMLSQVVKQRAGDTAIADVIDIRTPVCRSWLSFLPIFLPHILPGLFSAVRGVRRMRNLYAFNVNNFRNNTTFDIVWFILGLFLSVNCMYNRRVFDAALLISFVAFYMHDVWATSTLRIMITCITPATQNTPATRRRIAVEVCKRQGNYLTWYNGNVQQNRAIPLAQLRPEQRAVIYQGFAYVTEVEQGEEVFYVRRPLGPATSAVMVRFFNPVQAAVVGYLPSFQAKLANANPTYWTSSFCVLGIIFEEYFKYYSAAYKPELIQHPFEVYIHNQTGHYELLTIEQLFVSAFMGVSYIGWCSIAIAVLETALHLKRYASPSVIFTFVKSFVFHNISFVLWQYVQAIKFVFTEIAVPHRRSTKFFDDVKSARDAYYRQKQWYWPSNWKEAFFGSSPFAKGDATAYNMGRFAKAIYEGVAAVHDNVIAGWSHNEPEFFQQRQHAPETMCRLRDPYSDEREMSYLILLFLFFSASSLFAVYKSEKLRPMATMILILCVTTLVSFFNEKYLVQFIEFTAAVLFTILVVLHYVMNYLLGTTFNIIALTDNFFKTHAYGVANLGKDAHKLFEFLVSNYKGFLALREGTSKIIINSMGIANEWAPDLSQAPWSRKPVFWTIPGTKYKMKENDRNELEADAADYMGVSRKVVKNLIERICSVDLFHELKFKAFQATEKAISKDTKTYPKVLGNHQKSNIKKFEPEVKTTKSGYKSFATERKFLENKADVVEVPIPTHVPAISVCHLKDQKYPYPSEDAKTITVRGVRTCVSRYGTIGKIVSLQTQKDPTPCVEKAGLTLTGWGFNNGFMPQVFNRSCVSNLLNGLLNRVMKQSKNDSEIEGKEFMGTNEWIKQAIADNITCKMGVDELWKHIEPLFKEVPQVVIVEFDDWLNQFPEAKKKAIVGGALAYKRKLTKLKSDIKMFLKQGVCVHSLCAAFLKVEKAIAMMSLEDKPPRVRIIQPSHPASQLLLGPITLATGEWMKDYLERVLGVTYGGGMDAKGLGRWFTDAVNKCQIAGAMEVDGNAFDSTIGKSLKDLKKRMYRKMGFNGDHLKAFDRSERIVGQTQVLPQLGNIELKGERERVTVKYIRHYTVRSGLSDTTAGNTLTCAAILRKAVDTFCSNTAKSLDIPVSEVQRLLAASIIVMGDDMLMVFDTERLSSYFDTSDPWQIRLCSIVANAYAKVGIEPEAFFHHNAENASFCSKHFYRTGPGADYVATPHLARSCLRAGISENIFMDPNEIATWFLASGLSTACESGFLPVISALAFGKVKTALKYKTEGSLMTRLLQKMHRENTFKAGAANLTEKELSFHTTDYVVDAVSQRYKIPAAALRALDDLVRQTTMHTDTPLFHHMIINDMFKIEKAQFGAIPVLPGTLEQILNNITHPFHRKRPFSWTTNTYQIGRDVAAIKNMKDFVFERLKILNVKFVMEMLKTEFDESFEMGSLDPVKLEEDIRNRATSQVGFGATDEDYMVAGKVQGLTVQQRVQLIMTRAAQRADASYVHTMHKLLRKMGLPISEQNVNYTWRQLRPLLLASKRLKEGEPLLRALDRLL